MLILADVESSEQEKETADHFNKTRHEERILQTVELNSWITYCT
jgi:hypothetical protein